MNAPSSASTSAATSRRARIGLALLLAACLGVYAWTGPVAAGGISTPVPGAYYGLLVDAYLDGQLHLKLEPDPALKLLKNPWAGNQGVRRIHDATYYQDRYYLYFSFVPAVLWGVPWTIATGRYLTDGGLTFIAASLGLLFAGWFISRCWRRWFPDRSVTWPGAALLLVAFGNGVSTLVPNTTVYPAPIVAAYSFLMAALVALQGALAAATFRTRVTALALASLAWGIVVACRPNQLFTLPALGFAVVYLLIVTARERRGWSGGLLCCAAGLAPAALVGASIAAYNYARFGSIFEFGTTYMFTAGDSREVEMIGLHSILPNLRQYLLGPLLPRPYFPYLDLADPGPGLILVSPLAWLGLAWPLTLGMKKLRRDPAWVVLGLVLLATAVFSAVIVASQPGTNHRYRVDFTPALLLLGMLTAGALAGALGGRTGWSRAAAALLALAGAWTAACALSLFFIYNRPVDTVRPLARAFNRLTALAERWTGAQYGPATLRIRFPAGAPGRREPLVVSGRGSDVLYVQHETNGRVRFGFHHKGSGGPLSEPVEVQPGREYTLYLNLGCFYPPAEHPIFAGWNEAQIRLLRRQLLVSLDGRKVLDSGSEFYPTHPGDVFFGRYPWPEPLLAPGPFHGELGPPQRAGIDPLAVRAGPDGIGAVRLSLTFPEFRNFTSEPILSIGHKGAGDLIYVSYVAPGRIRFGHDSWGAGAAESPSVPYVPGEPQTLEVDLPSLWKTEELRPHGPVVLRYNGHVVLREDRPAHRGDPAEFLVGFNGSDSTAASVNFSGHISRLERVAAPQPAPPALGAGHGPVRLLVRFPTGRTGVSEPLLVTGRTGAADIFYVHYVDDAHIRLGHDHWSRGGPLSPPLAVNYAEAHTLDISLGTLYPSVDDPAWGHVPEAERAARRDTISVSLDGEIALSHTATAHPTQPEEILAGVNPIGASTCEPAFAGRIFWQERLGLPTAP